MRTIATLICGIVIVVGVFLPWTSGAVTELGFNLPESASGWAAMDVSGAPLLTFVGGILMIACVFIAYLLPLMVAVGYGVLQTIGIIARGSALFAVIGAVWFIINASHGPEAVTSFEVLNYGVFISMVFAALGLFPGVSTTLLASKEERIVASMTEETKAPRRAASYSGREYYERKSRETEAVDFSAGEYRESSAAGAAEGGLRTITEHFNQASYYESAGEYDKAIAEYSKAIRLDSKYALAYFNRGSLLKTQGKREEALADLEKVIELSDSPDLTRMAQGYIDELNR